MSAEGETTAPKPRAAPVAHRDKIWLNTAFMILMRLMGMGLRSVSWIMMSRYLGSEGVGIWGLLATTVELASGLGSFGVDIIGVRNLAVDDTRQSKVMGEILGLKLLLTTTAALFLLVFAATNTELSTRVDMLLILATGMFPQAVSSTLITRFQATHAMGRMLPLQGLTGLLSIGAAAAIVEYDLGIFAYLFSVVVLDFCSVLFVLVITRMTFGQIVDLRSMVPSPATLTLFKHAFPLGILQVLVLAYSRLNVLFLSFFSNLAAVVLYTQAVQLTSPVLMVASALSTSAFPVMAKMVKSRERDALRELFGSYTLRSMAMNAVLATVISFAAKPILVWIKPEFGAAQGAVIALAWATLCMFQNNLMSVVMHAFGKSHWVTGCAALNFVTFMISAPLLISRFGPTGGGLATLVVEGINMMVQMVLVRRLLHAKDD